MELKDFKLTKAKLGVMLMAVIVIIAASQLSPMFLSAGENAPQKDIKTTGTNSIRELSFDEEFTIKDPLLEAGGQPNGNFTGGQFMPASYKPGGTPRMNEAADSLIYENDSVFTMEGVKDELSQEGDWIKVTAAEVDPEGVVDNSGGFDNEINTDYIWRPRNVAAGWSPYTNGYWSYTNCGWMWVSYYSWGWRPYHYGRWWYSEYYGWVWSPGFIFAPAWVVWMYNDGYCGWYPISPRIRCHWDYGYRCHGMRYRVRHWNFCHKKDFANPLHPPVLIVDPSYNGGIIKTTKYDGTLDATKHGVKGKGPDVTDIEQTGNVKITTVDVTKYSTKVTVVRNDVKGNDKKRDDVVNTTKQGTGETPTKNDGTVNENNGGTTKQDGTNTIKQDGNNNTTKQDGNNNTKRDDGTKKSDPPPTKQNDPPPTKKNDPPPTKRNDPPPTKKDTYTPPPTKKEEPRKESYTPKNDTQPKKESTPPKRDNPPPKRETYTPPKNDNESKDSK